MNYLRLFWLLLLPVGLSAQSSTSSTNELVKYADAQIGTSDLLVNGKPFSRQNPNAAGSPFFLSETSVLGVISIKERQFPEQQLRYDIENDRLILSKTLQNGVPFEVSLYDNLVDTFQLSSHFFISKNVLTEFAERTGYAERIFQKKITLYRTVKVRFSNQISDKYPSGKYTKPSFSYFVFYKDDLKSVSNIKDFAQLFPEQEKEIRRFAKQEKIRLRNADFNELTRLLNFTNEKI